MKSIICLFVSFFLIVSCVILPAQNFVYYQSTEPNSCDLVIGLSQNSRHGSSLFEYKVTTKSRSAKGSFVRNGQQITFLGLYAARTVNDSKMEVSALMQGETLIIQNYGNGLNSYTLFSACKGKYLSLSRVRNET